MLINGMNGLGDNIYQRAFFSNHTRPVYLRTPWPQLYVDLHHVKCVRPVTNLRTQSKNVVASSGWHRAPVGMRQIGIRYGSEGILQGMQRCFGRAPGPMTLPNFGDRLMGDKYVIVRPVTVRKEWPALSRNPLPEYVSVAATAFAERGYKVISVADLQDGAEWAVWPLPFADVRYHSGELSVSQLLNLVTHAEAVIGGIGWLLPATIAAKTPAWIVCGGQGTFNAPDLVCPRDADVVFALPDNFCFCRAADHLCDKRISDYERKFASWFARFPSLV